MEMPKPGPGHLKLQIMAGNWTGEETMHPSPWDPKGGVATGKFTNRLALNGFALVNDYEQERNGITTFSGHGVMTYDPKSGLYSLHWFDCVGSPCEVFAGRFDGNRLTVAHGGPGKHARLTYDLAEPGRMRTTMEMSEDGNTWKALFEGHYGKI